MKKLLVLLGLLLSINTIAQTQSFGDQVKEIIVGRNKYKIAVKHVYSGGVIYIPMRKVFNGRVLREWVYSDFVFSTRYKALEVIKEWKEEEELDRKLKRVEYIYIK